MSQVVFDWLDELLTGEEAAGTAGRHATGTQVPAPTGSGSLERGRQPGEGGVILFDETIRQRAADGATFPDVLGRQGIIPGVKVDKGTTALAGFPGEKLTEGLDGLRDRLASYRDLGVRFTKWRAVITIGDGIPTRTCIDANAEALARFAALSQEAGLVPIVEPEVLMDGAHTIQRCHDVTADTLGVVFAALRRPPRPVRLEGRARQRPGGPAARKAFYHRARLNGAARFGRYTEEMEALGA